MKFRLPSLFFILAGIFFISASAASEPRQVVGVLKDYENTLLIEAENFEEKGGWVVDQQFMDLTGPGQAGSAVLLAHGMGKRVENAKTTIVLPKKGTYRIFARTRNWASPWIPEGLSEVEIRRNWSPGKFRVSAERREKVFLMSPKIPLGTFGNDWSWQHAGLVLVAEDGKEITVELKDLTGFDARVDALCFTMQKTCPLPDDAESLIPLRREALGLPEKTPDAREKPYDLVVVGGGLAGTCAAISAAKYGLDVALIQDRPVLGGNGSTEVRVHLNGDTNLPPYRNLGNLTNLMGPLGGGNAQPAGLYKDADRQALCDEEPTLDVYLSTHVFAVETDGSRVAAVIGKHIETGVETRFAARLFADCTGDATVGFLAGADWRQGTEAKTEFDEPYAPEEPQKMTMGASIQWYTVDAGRETSFPEIPWAHRFSPESIRPMIHGDWDWETGLTYDQIHDFERIRDNGLRAAYGHWDYMKNHAGGDWAEKTKTRELGWVAFIAGKRESRRLMGDIVLTGKDVVENRKWEDGCVTCSWAIDLHYPDPHNSRFFPGDEFRTFFIPFKKPDHYTIPYRTLYSRNVENLFMAGRNISVTHVALGTTRVMRTQGMMGEVVGMAAFLCKEHEVLPRGVYEKHLPELIELMKRGVDVKLPPNPLHVVPDWLMDASENFARTAKVAASCEHSSGKYPVKYIHDGIAGAADNGFRAFSENESRWVSGESGEDKWVEFTWEKPVTINSLRMLTGYASGGGYQDPVRNFTLQKWEAGGWRDIPEAGVTNNPSVNVGLRFPPVTADRVRVRMPGPEIVRIWEMEFYEVK